MYITTAGQSDMSSTEPASATAAPTAPVSPRKAPSRSPAPAVAAQLRSASRFFGEEASAMLVSRTAALHAQATRERVTAGWAGRGNPGRRPAAHSASPV